MNFAYIDTRSLLEGILAAPPERVEGIPWELPEEWKSFDGTLNDFKTEFIKARTELTKSLSHLSNKKEEINVLRMMIDNVNSVDLKERIEMLLDNYESQEGISALTLQCREMTGKVEAMKKVLMDTGAERYGKFTCFVCMDKLIDLFIDPCGHVICVGCWSQTRDKTQCPGCRTAVHEAKKIFNL